MSRLPVNLDEQQAALDSPRTCRLCGQTKKLRQFHMHCGSVCQACKESNRRLSADAKRDEMAKDAIKELVSHLRSDHIDVPHISEYCESVVARIGGVDIAAQHFVNCYHEAIKSHPGERISLDYHRALMKLVEASTEHRDSAPDIPSMSDAQLTEQIMAMAMPQLLRVISPDDWERAINELTTEEPDSEPKSA